ncbi:MAG: hypothetical protein M1170_00945 [Patescibacteria group bacterium]|nr:hypothetical protein [Patescibacteria group bacterium]
MKGEYGLKILETLEQSAQTIGNVFFIFSLPYGTSLNKGLKLLARRQREREGRQIDREEKLRFYDLLYRLRKEGLIENINKENKKSLQITKKGAEKLENLRLRKTNEFPQKVYKIENENTFKIIIFDIPEKHRKKRGWIREVLRNLKFKMLQKSVWIGKTKLPEELIHNLKNFDLLPYVEIFEISKTGSLKQLKT